MNGIIAEYLRRAAVARAHIRNGNYSPLRHSVQTTRIDLMHAHADAMCAARELIADAQNLPDRKSGGRPSRASLGLARLGGFSENEKGIYEDVCKFERG